EFAHDAAFARSAFELVQQLKAQRATAPGLAAAAATLEGEARRRSEWLASLWVQYDARLAALALRDREDVLAAAAAALEAGLPPGLAGLTRLEVRQLTDLAPSRVRV